MKYKGIDLPDGMREQTYKFIKNIISNFEKEKKLSALDNLCIYMLCDNVNMLLECQENIAKYGMVTISARGNQNLSPYAVQLKVVQSQITVLLKELGLTLGSRSKLKVIDSNISEEESPLMKLLNM